MKIAIVGQPATPCTRTSASSPRPDDAGLSELTRILARQGHRVTVYAQKRQPDAPDRAEPGGGLRVVHIPVGAVGKQDDAELLARVPAFSDRCGRAGAVSGLMSCTPSAGPAGSPL